MAIRQLARNCFSKMEWLVITRYIGSRRDLKVKYPRGRRKGFVPPAPFQSGRQEEKGEEREEREREGESEGWGNPREISRHFVARYLLLLRRPQTSSD